MGTIDIDVARAGDRAELLDFLHAVFLRNNPQHPRFEDLFPDIFYADTDETMRPHAVIRVDGRIASCVGAYPMTLRIAGCDVPIVGIGQVSTGAEHLGKGYMSALLREQLRLAREGGAALAWLGGRHDRYARFGFESASLGFLYGLDRRSVREVPRRRVVSRLPVPPGRSVPASLFSLREHTADSVAVTPERYARHLLRRSLEVWTSIPRGSSEPDAWVVFNAETRKLDEFSGSAEGCLEIAAALAADVPDGVQAAPSPANHALSEGLRKASVWVAPRMNMLSVINLDRLLDAYRPLLGDKTVPPPPEATPGELARWCFGPERTSFPVQLPFNLPDMFHI